MRQGAGVRAGAGEREGEGVRGGEGVRARACARACVRVCARAGAARLLLERCASLRVLVVAGTGDRRCSLFGLPPVSLHW